MVKACPCPQSINHCPPAQRTFFESAAAALSRHRAVSNPRCTATRIPYNAGVMTALVKILPPTLVAVLIALAIYLWLGAGPGVELAPRLPLPDEIAAQSIEAPEVDIEGFFTAGDGEPAELPGAWPGFRGPYRDGVSSEAVSLVRTLADVESRRVWSIAAGEGYAGAAILNGRAYLLDYDQQVKADTLRCLSLADGTEIWRRGYYVQIKRNHGMSRTVPAVTDKYVLTIGPKCQVMCARSDSGEFLWGIDLARQYDTVVPDWYTGQCPLIDGDRAIIAPSGKALMIAVDCETGKVAWEAPNPHGWRMTHSSITPMDLDGKRTYVYCASGGVSGISAADGRTVWQTADWTVNMANTPSPVIVPPDRIFLCGGYGAGSMMIRIVAEGDKYKVQELFRLKPEQFGSEQQTPILYRDHIYGVREDGQLVCLDLDGRVVWASGRMNRFGRKGRGPAIIADGVLIVLTGDGELVLVRASPARFEKLAAAKVLHEGESWGPMAIAGGRLVLRDLTTMVCLDMRSVRRAGPP